jgi:hypothetical protein
MTIVMRKLEALKFLEARLADIEREHYDELAREAPRSDADARAEAKALAAVYDFLKDCKISIQAITASHSRALPAPKAKHRSHGEINITYR